MTITEDFREEIVNFIANHRETFQEAVVAMETTPTDSENDAMHITQIRLADIFINYFAKLKKDRCWGDTIYIEAACLLYDVRVSLLVSPAS